MFYLPEAEYDPTYIESALESYRDCNDPLLLDLAGHIVAKTKVDLFKLDFSEGVYLEAFCYGSRAFEYMQRLYSAFHAALIEADLNPRNLFFSIGTEDLVADEPGEDPMWYPRLTMAYHPNNDVDEKVGSAIAIALATVAFATVVREATAPSDQITFKED